MALYLTNATSRAAPYRGTGRVWSIMAAPRAQYGELGDGKVEALVPPLEWVRAARSGQLSVERYRDKYLGLLDERDLRTLVSTSGVLVAAGDTLICACSRTAAAAGRCHRCWAASALCEAGWDVILDGNPVGGGGESGTAGA